MNIEKELMKFNSLNDLLSYYANVYDERQQQTFNYLFLNYMIIYNCIDLHLLKLLEINSIKYDRKDFFSNVKKEFKVNRQKKSLKALMKELSF